MLPTDAAREVFQWYLKRSQRTGEIVETIEESFERVARCIADEDDEPQGFYQELLAAMTELRMLPNRPAWFGLGTHTGMASACTMIFVQDSLVQGQGSILGSLHDVVAIQHRGSGVGQYFGYLRPKGSTLYRGEIGDKSRSAIEYLEIYDKFLSFANNASFPIDHPDIIEFINCKVDEHAITKYNTNVHITDEFLSAVQADGDFDLRFGGKVHSTIKAKELFDVLTKAIWANGGMGVQYYSEIMRKNTIADHSGDMVANPCGEFFGFDGESCCPSYINLHKVSESGSVDWAELARLTRISARMLDNQLDANRYVPEVPKLERMARWTRRIGTGITGLADMLLNLGYRYGSDDSIDAASQVMEFILHEAIKESVRLSKVCGPFPAIDQSIFSPGNFRFEVPKPYVAHKLDLGRPALPWSDLVADMKKHGVRNCGFTVIPPASFGSQTMCTEGYGIEPIFSADYTYDTQEHKPRFVTKYDVNSPAFVTAHDVSPEEHMRMQSAMQRFVTEGISKTINVPNETTQEDIGRMVLTGREMGLKGIMIYRDGSRKDEVMVCQLNGGCV